MPWDYIGPIYLWCVRSSFILRITYPQSSVTPRYPGLVRRPPGMWRSPEPSPGSGGPPGLRATHAAWRRWWQPQKARLFWPTQTYLLHMALKWSSLIILTKPKRIDCRYFMLTLLQRTYFAHICIPHIIIVFCISDMLLTNKHHYSATMSFASFHLHYLLWERRTKQMFFEFRVFRFEYSVKISLGKSKWPRSKSFPKYLQR